jgi:hypothetical protein
MISEKFTIEDIHRIRYENYERRKNKTAEEVTADIEKGASEARRIIEELREKRKISEAEKQ